MRLNQERYGTDFDFSKAWAKLSEEMDEFTEANADNDIDGMVDALADIMVVATGELTKLRYNPELCLKQCVKHISARKQDPEQAARWQAGNKEPGEKWLKDKNQDPATIPEPNYSLCKLASKKLVNQIS